MCFNFIIERKKCTFLNIFSKLNSQFMIILHGQNLLMKINLIILLLLFCFCIGNAQKLDEKNKTLKRPKLVVGLVVDQMRWDFLYRYYNRYQNGGFKRLLSEGFSCENTNIDYVPTVTGIGHSTIYTGSVPAIHGIAGNDFIIQATGNHMYCTEDSTVQTVGSTSKAGQMSPRNMLSTTITDELRLATNFKSKVIGISLKDRGGILPAGHSANAAYWFDDATNGWITSTYYMQDLPDWVKQLNDQKLPEKYLKQDWNTLYPISTYTQSTTDDNKYEGKFSNSSAPVFPIKTSDFADKPGRVRSTPYGNTLTLDLAKSAIENESFGKTGNTDFLAVSLSSPDYIGHQFGPNSIEIEDTYLRLDRDIADFLTYLDTKMGKGNYTIFLSADHGAAHNPVFLNDNNIPAGVFSTGNIHKELNKQLEAKYNQKNLVLSMMNYQVHLNNPLIKTLNLNEDEIIRDCINYLHTHNDIAQVIDIKNAASASIPSIMKEKIINGYNKDRSGSIQIILRPGYFSGGKTGTTHGTWNPFDTHIPLVFMGWGIKQGSSNLPVNMSDIAATLAALLHIQVPNGNIGKAVVEALK